MTEDQPRAEDWVCEGCGRQNVALCKCMSHRLCGDCHRAAPPALPPSDQWAPTVADVDGRIVVAWPNARVPVVVWPDVIEGWAAHINALRDELAELREHHAVALDNAERHGRGLTDTLAEVDRLRGLLAAADEFGDRHVIDLREDGWTIAHPLSCRARGLFACPLNTAATDLGWPPEVGRFAVTAEDGGLVLGERIDDVIEVETDPEAYT